MVTAQWYYTSLTSTSSRSLTSEGRIVVSPAVYRGANQYSTSLTINAAMISDIGAYQCVGSSTNGMSTGYGSLTVLG